MPNDAKTLLLRKSISLGAFSRFSLQPFPSLPASFIKRFPELQDYEDAKKRWLENTNQILAEKLSAAKNT
jgi:hypothetical protein